MKDLLLVARHKRMASRFLEELLHGFERNAKDETGRLPVAGVKGDYGESFTKRELDVMRLICTGAANQEICKKLFLGLSTVKNHTHSIYQKLGVRNRAEAIVRIRERGLVEGFVDES
jgi:DNA-binding NarL/FixJ family response regulator